MAGGERPIAEILGWPHWVDEHGNPAPESMREVLAEADRIMDALEAGDKSVLGEPMDVEDFIAEVNRRWPGLREDTDQ